MTTEREFTEYDNGLVIEFMPNSHRYALIEDDERRTVPSVTGILGILDKPNLRRWYGKEDSIAVLEMERAGELVGVPSEQAIYIARDRGLGAEGKRDAGAERGTAVHDALERFCTDGTVPALGDYSEAVRGYVQAVCGFLIEHDPEPILTEQIVGSPTHLFAGRFDLLCTIDGVRTIVDLKTSARTYPEHHIQMAAYELAMPECGIDPPERSLIVAVAETGHYQTVEGQGKPEHFLGVLGAYKAMSSIRSAVKAAEKAVTA